MNRRDSTVSRNKTMGDKERLKEGLNIKRRMSSECSAS